MEKPDIVDILSEDEPPSIESSPVADAASIEEEMSTEERPVIEEAPTAEDVPEIINVLSADDTVLVEKTSSEVVEADTL